MPRGPDWNYLCLVLTFRQVFAWFIGAEESGVLCVDLQHGVGDLANCSFEPGWSGRGKRHNP